MKKAIRKYWAVVLVFVIVISVCLLFSGRKSGMFIDEIYTYGLSNSSYAPFLRDMKGGSIQGKIFTRSDFLDYVTVNGDEGFDFGSVYYNQVNDVHPPLYYWLFNVTSTLFNSGFTKWTGLILDLVIYAAALVLLYRLSVKLFHVREIGAAVVVLYGLSLLGESTMLMIRMYVLLMLWTVWLAYLIASLMDGFSKRGCVLTGVCLFLGLMTQYYFVFYAFFLCAAFVFWLIAKKRYSDLKWFVPSAFIGVGLFVAVFPACLDHLFSDKLVSGTNAVENLGNTSQYAYRLSFFFSEVRHGLKAAIIVGILCVIVLVILNRRLRLQARLGRIDLRSLVLIIPAFITLVVVAIISPVDEQRYVYNIAPIFVLFVGFVLYLIDISLFEYGEGNLRTVLLLLIAAVSLWGARSVPPQYLYPEYARYDEIIAEHDGEPCVYFTDEHFEPMTQDLIQLSAFEDVYVTNKEEYESLLPYVGDEDSFVAFVDVSRFWSSGYDPDEIIASVTENTEFTNCELLYKNQLSETYRFTR